MTKYEFRAVCVDLDLKPSEINRLEKTVSMYQKSWKAVEEWCRKHKSTEKMRAHKDLYVEVKEKVSPNLPSALIQSSRDHAIGSMKSYNRNNPSKRYEKELFLTSRMMKYSERAVTLTTEGVFTFTLVDGPRAKTKIKVNRYFTDKYGENWKFKTAEIGFDKNGKPIAVLIYRHELPELRKEGKIVGVDQGIVNLVYTSEGVKYDSKKTGRLNRRRDYNLKSLGAKLAKKPTRSARRARRRIWRKNARFSTEQAHKVTKQLSEDETVKVYVLEDLTGLYQKKSPKPLNRKKRNWAPGKFAQFLEYKCASKGIEVAYVDPAYTSQTCSECGYQNKENRNSAVFKCLECGYYDHADFNASKNIRNLYVSELSSPAKGKGHRNAKSKGAVRQGVCQSPDDVPPARADKPLPLGSGN